MKKILLLTYTWCLAAINAAAPDSKSGKIDFAVGGQAVIEGVMMRAPHAVTVAVRKADGSMKIKKDQYTAFIARHKWLNVPIVRGVIGLFEMMIIGTKAINFSADEFAEDEEDIAKGPQEKTKLMQAFEAFLFVLSFVIAMSFSLFLFKYLPLWITTFIDGKVQFVNEHFIVFNIIDGLLKMTIFITYISILGAIPSFRRIFEYHGAEHKAIFNYEEGTKLTPENSQKQSRFHPRCGTSFILIVFVISILFYTTIPKQEVFFHNFLMRATLLPFVAGISYEYLKWSAKYAEHSVLKALVVPGLWFQRLTTREPDKQQLEVSIASLNAALELEKKHK